MGKQPWAIYPAFAALASALAVMVSSEVGETRVSLPATGRYAATLGGGVGAVTVQLPQGLAVEPGVSRGVGAVTIRDSVNQDGERYLSPGYDEAGNRVALRVTGGVGAVTVVQNDEQRPLPDTPVLKNTQVPKKGRS